MGKVLFVTVGSSPAPIIRAAQDFKPDYTYFIVTEDTENNKGSINTVVGDEYEAEVPENVVKKIKKFPTISKQLSLMEDQFETIIVESDNPFDVYEKVAPVVEKHLGESDTVHIDCTGGTKSMSVGLAYIHTEYPETELSVVTGPRNDLVKVSSGMERVKRFEKNKVYINRQLKSSEALIAERNYNGAYRVLVNLFAEVPIEDDTFDRLYLLSKGFDYWDKFQYEKASPFIERYKNDETIKPYNATLKQLIRIEQLVKNWTPETRIPTNNGFILVYDLLYNAERKAAAKYYDDAVSRLYRALEMYEQFVLFTNNPSLDTSDLDVSALPENIRSSFNTDNDSKKIQIGLKDGYDLLGKLNHPVGKVWTSYKNKILDALKFRNDSYFAHGFNPVTKENYESMKNVVWDFIYECDQAMKFRSTVRDYLQLPEKF